MGSYKTLIYSHLFPRLIGNYSREQADYRYVLYTTPLQKTRTILLIVIICSTYHCLTFFFFILFFSLSFFISREITPLHLSSLTFNANFDS